MKRKEQKKKTKSKGKISCPKLFSLSIGFDDKLAKNEGTASNVE